jgi:hypothetical protein
VTVESDRHPKKDPKQSFSTEDGMQMDEREEQPSKTDQPRAESLESGAKVTVERERHCLKALGRISSTEEGMQMDESDEHSSKTDQPRVESLEPASKVTVATCDSQAT